MATVVFARISSISEDFWASYFFWVSSRFFTAFSYTSLYTLKASFARRVPKYAFLTWVTISSLEERAFSTAISTSSPESFKLFQSCAFTKGMAAEIPADHVFQRPTSIPSDMLGIAPASEEGGVTAPSPEPPSAPPSPAPPPRPPKAPPRELISKSIYITCFLIVLWYAPEASI